jgi:hypothetical protein
MAEINDDGLMIRSVVNGPGFEQFGLEDGDVITLSHEDYAKLNEEQRVLIDELLDLQNSINMASQSVLNAQETLKVHQRMNQLLNIRHSEMVRLLHETGDLTVEKKTKIITGADQGEEEST